MRWDLLAKDIHTAEKARLKTVFSAHCPLCLHAVRETADKACDDPAPTCPDCGVALTRMSMRYYVRGVGETTK